jgi:hypothetical protein
MHNVAERTRMVHPAATPTPLLVQHGSSSGSFRLRLAGPVTIVEPDYGLLRFIFLFLSFFLFLALGHRVQWYCTYHDGAGGTGMGMQQPFLIAHTRTPYSLLQLQPLLQQDCTVHGLHDRTWLVAFSMLVIVMIHTCPPGFLSSGFFVSFPRIWEAAGH